MVGAMEPADVSAYLERIGYVGSREPTTDTLRALHRAHLATVPFENLDIHAGRPIRLDRAAFFRKIVGERRGGFCYELNGLFGDLLSSMGFQVSLLSARVPRHAGGFGPEFDHLVLLVTSEARWIADVGFGRSFQEPLSLDHSSDHEADGLIYDTVAVGDELHMRSRAPGTEPRAEYAFTLRPRQLEDFAAMCEYHQTSPQSHFTKQAVCSMPTARGRVTVSGRTLLITDKDSRQEIPLQDDAAVAAALREHFGIRLPLRPGA
jgi:N-hydroxyarylamine O-acetyltransferase